MLEAALAAGITAAGGEALLGGVLPTPAAPLLLHRHGLDLAVVISASHNPYRDNGIKFFGADGHKLSDAAEAAIEAALDEPPAPGRPRSAASGALDDTLEDYLAALHERFGGLDLSGLDVAPRLRQRRHPRAPAPEIFARLGADVDALAAEPDGRNINEGCGSTHVDAARRRPSRDGGHDVGFAFDGDGDRVLAADRNGDGRRRRRADRPRRAAPALRRPPPRRRRRGHGDDELRLPRGDGASRHRGRDHDRRRPLRARGDARPRLGARRRAVGPHHRDAASSRPATASPARC